MLPRIVKSADAVLPQCRSAARSNSTSSNSSLQGIAQTSLALPLLRSSF